MTRKISAVGIDRGGASVRILALDSSGRTVKKTVFASSPIHTLPSMTLKILKKWKTPPDVSIVISTKGAWSKEWKKPFLQDSLAERTGKVKTVSDMEGAYWASLGDKPGIVVLAGTGSVAFGKDSKGNTAKAGGMGPSTGDPGSGYWIGLKYLNLKGKKPGHTASDTRKTASLAQSVIKKAKNGDTTAKMIIAGAQMHLCFFAVEVIKKLGLKYPVNISWCGSILENDFFRKGFAGMLIHTFKPGKFRFIPPSMTPVEAAARHALKILRNERT